MNRESFLKSAGLWPQRDEVGLWQWRVGGEVQPRIRRFDAFIHEVLHSPPENTDALAARLVCLDGISPGSLREMEKQCVVPYRVEEDIEIEWEELSPPRTERRVLSRLTAALWSTAVSEAGSTACIAPVDLVAGLEVFLAHSSVYKTRSDRTIELERDALCWWYQCLPAPLFAHLSGLQLLSALPRSALARACRQLAVIHPPAEGQNPDQSDADLGFAAEMIDAASYSEGSDRSSVILKLGIDLMQIAKQEMDGTTKRRWAQGIFDLQARAQAAGPFNSLLLAWGLVLCENGTVGESNPARTTVRQYFRRAALPLFETLRLMSQNFDSPEWGAVAMRERYLGMMEAQSVGNKKTMASALTNFHSFLSEWFDIEPLAKGLHADVPVARVRAQVIWPHEVELVMTWLEQVDDVRVKHAAMIMLSVARESPARTNELLRLRLANVREGQDDQGRCLEMEIARLAVFGRLKTTAAQRRLIIRDEATINLILSWVERRISEGAPSSAFLFGDPGDDARIHRGGAVVSLLNRLLKVATGEPGARIHALRHGAVSARIGPDLDSSSVTDSNRHVITAVETGHATAVSVLTSYFHQYESGLRVGLDAALLELIQLTSAEAGPLLSLKPATLRQHAHRKDMRLDEFLWWRLRDTPIAKPFADVAEAFRWHAPARPKLLPHADAAITAAVALSWLEQLFDGATQEVLGLRFGVAQTILEKMSRDFTSFCLNLARCAWPRRFNANSPQPADFRHAVSMVELDLARAHQPKFQKLQDWLSKEQALPVLRNACASWHACRHGSHIALDRRGKVLDLYKLLLEAQVDPLDLRICIQVQEDEPDRRSPHDGRKLHEALVREEAVADFLTVFGVRPRESSPQARLGRPAAYLQWDDPDHRENPSSASSSCAGLDTWMSAVAALLSIKESQS